MPKGDIKMNIPPFKPKFSLSFYFYLSHPGVGNGTAAEQLRGKTEKLVKHTKRLVNCDINIVIMIILCIDI